MKEKPKTKQNHLTIKYVQQTNQNEKPPIPSHAKKHKVIWTKGHKRTQFLCKPILTTKLEIADKYKISYLVARKIQKMHRKIPT